MNGLGCIAVQVVRTLGTLLFIATMMALNLPSKYLASLNKLMKIMPWITILKHLYADGRLVIMDAI